MRWLTAALAVGLILVPGCLEERADGDPGPVVLTEPATTGLVMEDCFMLEAFANVDPAAVSGLVPDDFVVFEAGGQALVVFGAVECSAGFSGARTFLAIRVDPLAAELQADGETNYFWEPEHWAAEGEFTWGLESFGQAAPPMANFSAFSFPPFESSVSVELDNDTYQINMAGPLGPLGEAAMAFGHFREYFAMPGGYGYLEATYAAGDPGDVGGGIATVTAPEGSLVAELLVGTGHPTLAADGIKYADASVGFVPFPSA